MTKQRLKVKRSDRIKTEHLHLQCRVHNGRQWVEVRPVKEMVHLKFGELVKSRTRRAQPLKSNTPRRPATR